MKPIAASLRLILENLEDKSTHHDQINGLKTGFKYLDEMTGGLKKGELIIIGSRPSHSKTSLALQIAYNACLEEKKPIAYFSSESLAEELALTLLTQVSRVDSKRLKKKKLIDDDLEKITSANFELGKLPIFINDQ